MTDVLIIFIDGFPFNFLKNSTYLKNFPTKRRLVPGFGYSVNIYYELFSGKHPDEIGFFNQWGLDFAALRVSNGSVVRRLLRPLRSLSLLDLLIHRGLRTITSRYLNVPFHLHGYFLRHPFSVYEESAETIFSLFPPDNRVFSEAQQAPPGQQDKRALERAMTMLESTRSLYVSLVDMDWVGHRYGIQSREYLDHVKFLDAGIGDLVESHRVLTGGTGTVFVCSDHGMSQVEHGVDLRPEKELGPAGPETYLYFLDSTMARFWIFAEGWRERIESYLANFNVGRIVHASERAKCGIGFRHAGDIFYLLNEGYVFAPSFQRHRFDRGMHGYDPKLPNQHGIFLSTDGSADSEPITSVEVYKILSDFLPLQEQKYTTAHKGS
jgi:Type I phosphodiesterase / nucleotide pyrophosphatase